VEESIRIRRAAEPVELIEALCSIYRVSYAWGRISKLLRVVAAV
jgi:hypothetical protein